MPKKRSVNNGSTDFSSIKSRSSLAAFNRDRYPAHIWTGQNIMAMNWMVPKVEAVPDGTHCSDFDEWAPPDCACRLRVVEHRNPEIKMSFDQILLIQDRMANRSWGQPAQHQVIEAEVSGQVTAIVGGVDPHFFKQMGQDALSFLGSLLQGRAPATLPPPDAQDVEFVEHLLGPEEPEDEPT